MILISDPVLTPSRRHIDDLGEFYALNKSRHDLVMHREWGRPLHKALANVANRALREGASHVLFTEQDHWGYPDDGLDRLLAHSKDVVDFVTHYSCDPQDVDRALDQYVAYPFAPMCMRKCKPDISLTECRRNLRSFTPLGLEKTDLLTWAFTLVKAEVFQRMANHGLNPFLAWDTHPPDSHFCDACEILDINRWVDGTTMIEHGDVPNRHIEYYRRVYADLHRDIRTARLSEIPPVPAWLVDRVADLNAEPEPA